MRVEGNMIPQFIQVEAYFPRHGYAEVRLRENVKLIDSTTMLDGTMINLYEYDEYVFLEKDRPNLKEEILANIENWLATGRELEIRNRASTLVDAQDEAARVRAENEAKEAHISAMTAAHAEGVASA